MVEVFRGQARGVMTNVAHLTYIYVISFYLSRSEQRMCVAMSRAKQKAVSKLESCKVISFEKGTKVQAKIKSHIYS